MDHGHLRRVSRQKEGLLRCRVATTYNRHRSVAKKIAITGGTGGNAVTEELPLGFQAEHLGGGAAGNDQGTRLNRLFVRLDREGALGKVDSSYVTFLEFCAENLGLFLHHLNQLRSLDALREPGVVLDQCGQT